MVEDFEEILLMENQFDKFDIFPLEAHTPYYCKYRTKKGEIKSCIFSLPTPRRWMPHKDIWKFKDTSGKWYTINLNNIIEFHQVKRRNSVSDIENALANIFSLFFLLYIIYLFL